MRFKRLCLLLTMPVLLAAGSVQTRDGKTIDGEVTVAENAVVVQPAAPAQAVRINVTNVQRLTFKSAPLPKRISSAPDSPLPPGFKSQDIGLVYRAGSATCDPKGLFTLKASGYGAWGPRDSFHYASTPMSGDGQIIARLAGVDDSHGQMVAGIMIRQNLSPESPMAGASMYPSGEVRLSHRPHAVISEFRNPGDAARRPWLRLTRRGDVFTAYCSSDGKYWGFIDSQTIQMQDPVLVGLAAWTTSNSSLGQVQFDSVLLVPGTSGATWFESGSPLLQGIAFRDGTTLAGTIISTDETSVKFSRNGQESTLPLAKVASIVFNPLPPDQSQIRGKKGVWLVNGDFIEGDISAIARRPVDWPRQPQLHVGISSVLFGIKNFEAARDVIAVVFSDVAAAPAAFEVRTADGSVHRAKSLTLRMDTILADDITIPDVIEILRL